MSLQKYIIIRSKKIRESARGEECTIRIPGVCNRNPETVVFCHDDGGGVGGKASDVFGAYGCSSCHDVVDGRVQLTVPTKLIKEKYFNEAIKRTQQILINKGLLKV